MRLAEDPRCQRCGVILTGQAVGELCANCLLKLALDPAGEEAPSALSATDDAPPVDQSAIDNRQAGIGSRDRYFGDYELLRQIGRGGMGVVYEARQISLNRTVALKMILGGDLASSSAIRRFQIEAEAAAKLEHPNIVAIHEFGEREGLPFFSMQRIEGTSLDREMAALALTSMDGTTGKSSAHKSAARQTQVRIARLVAILARALHYAHEQGVIHCDVKPGNILIDSHGQPHLTDFGIALLLNREGLLTNSGVIGTPRYMSHEQASGRRGDVTAATDIHGLGVILYELLTGQPPFCAATPNETLRQVMEREPAAPHDSNRVVNRDLSIICLKCLEKNTRHRYASAAELADDLDRWTHQEPILARRASAPERLVRWCQRKPAIATLIASVALLLMTVAVGSVLFALDRSEKEKQRELALSDREAALEEREESMARLPGQQVRMDCTIYRSYTHGHQGFLSGDVAFLRVGLSSYVEMKDMRPRNSLLVAEKETVRCVVFTRANSGIKDLNEVRVLHEFTNVLSMPFVERYGID